MIRDQEWIDPQRVASVFAPETGTQFFHSSATGRASRWSVLAVRPEQMINQWHALQAIADAPLCGDGMPPSMPHPWPFVGGWAGLIGYDTARAAQGVPTRHAQSADPSLFMGYYDQAFLFDHHAQRMGVLGPDPERINALVQHVRAHLSTPPSAHNSAMDGPSLIWQPSVPDDRMQARVADLVRAIHNGTLFQANLALTYHASLAADIDLFSLYCILAGGNPAPFGGYANLGDVQLLSLSPEQFINVRDGWITTSPIKGTRKRDPDPDRDRALAHALEHDAKERAENTMIVDLMRNDLAPYVDDDTLEVPVLCAVETHPSVHHLVSHVRGRLRAGCSPLAAWMGMLPGGSITGAPKHQAMLEIDRHEDRARGFYCGSWGYVSDCGRMDSNILIRSIIAMQGNATLSVGAGITALSDPAQEVAEMHLKAHRLLAIMAHQMQDNAA